MNIRTGDIVVILTGKDRGKKGKVVRVLPRQERVVVEGANIAKKHLKPTPQHPHGGIVEVPLPLHVSNVSLVCVSCNTSVRSGVKTLADGTKVRVCKRCGEAITNTQKKAKTS